MIERAERRGDAELDPLDEVADGEARAERTPGHRTLTAKLSGRLYRALDPAADPSTTGPWRRHLSGHLARALGEPGQGLPEPLRKRLELALHRDLAGVRVHTSAAAAAAAAAAGARAVTTGEHILFADGAYAPGTRAGDELIAHEATHAAHHRGEPGIGAHDAPEEREAEAVAAAVTHDPAVDGEPLLDAARDLEAAWHGPPPAGLSGRGGSADREAVRAALARAGHQLDGDQLDVVTQLWGRSLPLTRHLWHGPERGRHLDRMLEHAGHHCGLELGNVKVVDDPSLRSGRVGETRGDTIHVAPGLTDDAAGRQVLAHEAAHVAQTRRPGPIADRALVEAEAHAVADAAERGERLEPQLRADPDDAYGLDLSLPDLSPIALLRQVSPTAAQFVEEGLEGQLAKIGEAVNGALKSILDGLGLGEFTSAFESITSALKPGSLAYGVLTGCCDCLDAALGKLLASLDGFLASDGAKRVQKAIADSQQAEKDGVLDVLTDVFALLKKIGGPVLSIIEGAGNAIAAAKQKLGIVADKVWQFICGRLGLDANLPPLDAIKKKLQELWDKAAAALAPLKNAITSAINWLKSSSPLAPLFKLAGDLQKLVAAVRKLVAAKATDAKTWLATLAKELAGTVFEPLIQAIQTGRQTLDAAAAAVASWFKGVLDKLGLLESWNSTVAFINSVVSTVKGFVGRVKAGLEAIGKKVEEVLKEVSEGAKKIYDAVKPYLDFVVGFVMAAMATAGGNLFAFPMFLAGNLWLHVLPDCYKDSILNFILDAFIKVVEWYPAQGMPLATMMRGAVLGFLRRMRAMDRNKKIQAMDTVASFFAGNVEFAAGLIVGIFKGIYESTIGTVVFVFEVGAWLAEMGAQITSLGGQSIMDLLAGGSGIADFLREAGEPVPAEDGAEGEQPPEAPEDAGSEADDGADDDVEEDGTAEVGEDEDPDDAPDEDSEPGGGGEEEPQLDGTHDDGPAGETPSTDDTPAEEPAEETPSGQGDEEAEQEGDEAGADDTIDPAPPMPADLLNGRALFDAVFKDGVTRADLEELFNAMSTSLEAAASRAGAVAADMLIAELTKKGAAYDIGEKVGIVVGMVIAEVVIAYFTAGAGLAKTGVTLTKMTLKLAKSMPALMKVLRTVAHVVKPLLGAFQKLKKGIGAWAGKIAKYIDDLIEWAAKNIKKIIARIKRWLRGKKKPPRRKPPRRKPPRKPRDRDKRDANLRLAAHRAATAGWSKMSSLSGAVHGIAAVRAKLTGQTVRRARGITLRLSIAGRGSGWKVKAVASKRMRRATARSGSGWITRAYQNRTKYYALRSYARLHQDIIDDAIRALRQDDHDDKSDRGEYDDAKAVARRQEEAGQRRIELRGIKFEIKMEGFQGVERDHQITTDLIITPNAKHKKIELNLPSAEDLKTAKAEFRTRLFKREELITALSKPERTVDSRIADWKRSGDLFTNESDAYDPAKYLTFSRAKAGERPLNDSISNRAKYGFINPAKDSAAGITILRKGWINTSPAPPDENSRYNSMRPGSAYRDFPYEDAILGHSEDCAAYWNREGHKHSRSENTTWNKDPSHYWGPEHRIESAASGGSTVRYMTPTKALGSHEDWLY